MVIAGHRDRRERVLRDVVIVHEAARAHRDPLRGRRHPVRPGVRDRPGNRAHRRRRAEAAELALRERSIDDDASREAGDNRSRRVADRARAATAAAAPEHVGEAQLGQAERRRDAHRIVAVVGVRGDAVDRRHRQSGVVGCALNRFEREAEFADRRGAAFVIRGLAESGDRDLVLDCEFAHRHAAPIALSEMRGRFQAEWRYTRSSLW